MFFLPYLLAWFLSPAHADDLIVPVPPVTVHITGPVQCVTGGGSTIACVPSGGPPVPPCPSPPGVGPCGGPPTISCTGFTNTLVMKEDWANPKRMYTKDYGSFGLNDAVVAQFTVGNVSSPNNNLPRISAAEWLASPYTRLASLSPKPCDWSPQPNTPGGLVNGTGPTIPFAVGFGYNFGYYPIVPLNGTVYFNIKNDPNGGCAGDCGMFIELIRPPGM